MKDFIVRSKLSVAQFRATALAVSVAALAVASPAFAQAADPTTSIVATLTTYGTDVGLLAVAVLLIFYGKKLVSFLKV